MQTLPLFLLIACAINAMLLRAAVGFLNAPDGYKVLPRDTTATETPSENSNETATSQNPFASKSQTIASSPIPNENPFASPSALTGTESTAATTSTQHNVVTPSFAKALGIVSLQGIAIVALYILGTAIPAKAIPYQSWLGWPLLVLSFLATCIIYSQMLPSSFGRAALVFSLQILLTAVVAVPITMLVCVIAVIY